MNCYYKIPTILVKLFLDVNEYLSRIYNPNQLNGYLLPLRP